MGGYDVSIEEDPYQINYGDICGGALIHHRWAMTSAHCGQEDNFIRIGSKHQLKGPKVRVLSHLVHPNYGEAHTYDYDIQLLMLYRKLRFHKTVKAIEINSNHDGRIIVSGWGYLKEKGEYNDLLQQVELKIIPLDKCQQVRKPFFNNTLTDRMFCAYKRGKDACQGDSGGAAVSLDHAIGISSFGFGCGRNIPGVYVNISERNIRGWIRVYTGV